MTVSQSGTVSYSIVAGGGSLNAGDQAKVDNLAANTSAQVVALSAASTLQLSYIVALSAHDTTHDAQIAALSAQAAALNAADQIIVKTAFSNSTLSSAANVEPGTINRGYLNLIDATRTRLETNLVTAIAPAGQQLKAQYTVDTDQSATSVWADLGPVLETGALPINFGYMSTLVSVPSTAKITAGTWVRLYVSGVASANNQFKNPMIAVEIPARGPAGADGAQGDVFSMSALLDITGNVVNERFAIGTDSTVRLDNTYIEAVGGQARFGLLRGTTTVIDSGSVNSWVLNNESTAFVFNSATPQQLNAWGPLSIRVTNASALSGIAIGFVGYPM